MVSEPEPGKREQTSTPTELVHLTYDGNFQLECSATVVGCWLLRGDESSPDTSGTGTAAAATPDDGSPPSRAVVEVQLDATTMHPQGGGQPTDHGVISAAVADNGDSSPGDVAKSRCTVRVDQVSLDRGTNVVTHRGTVVVDDAIPDADADLFEVGSKVHVSVDVDRRRLLSECHTAGHVVDAAMARCDQIMPPTKGYHFLDGPYVEYRGKIPPGERPGVLERLKVAFQEIVNEVVKTTIEILPKARAEEECNRLAQNFDLSEYAEDVRIVTIAGWSCPCGGTHVASTIDLKGRGWGVTGIKCKKDVVRVKYGPTAAT